ncbi:MAG: decaprenyl-phosphate phosphoribosyltransferase [Bacteroidota bacterium]
MANQLRYIVASMRLQQWIKNLFLFAALVFSGHLFRIDYFVLTLKGFLFFSLISSGVYIFNDITDLENDKLHPVKSKRALASGHLKLSTAYVSSAVLAAVGLAGGFVLRDRFGTALVVYLAINILYSVKLKDVVILDVMAIAGGFVLRVIAGAVLIDVPTSVWLLICTVLLSLFLGFSKRRHELMLLEGHAESHRSVLQYYSPYFLDQMIGIVTASTVMSYALYTISEETIRKFGTTNLIYTVPFVLYGIFRYLYLVHKKEEGGNPTRLALTDLPLVINILCWVIVAVFIIYWK